MFLTVILSLVFTLPQQSEPTVAVTMSANTPAVIMPLAEAEREYRELKRYEPVFTEQEAKRFRALTVALGILPDPLSFVQRLTYFERHQCLSETVCMCCH